MGSGAYLRTRCSTEPTWERPWGLITELPDQGQVPLLDLSPQGKESPSLLKALHGQLLSPTAKSTSAVRLGKSHTWYTGGVCET